MDHLALVVSASDRNKMSAQNLAIAMAPPLILHSTQDTPGSTHPPMLKTVGQELDYEQPIGILKYLLQIWPAPKSPSGNVMVSQNKKVFTVFFIFLLFLNVSQKKLTFYKVLFSKR